jgi:hypothetical protein
MRLRKQARVCKQHESGPRMWQIIMSAAKPYRACGVSKDYRACALRRPQAVARGHRALKAGCRRREPRVQLHRLRAAVGDCLLQQPVVQPHICSVQCTSRVNLPNYT